MQLGFGKTGIDLNNIHPGLRCDAFALCNGEGTIRQIMFS
jgi:hypothetical protein